MIKKSKVKFDWHIDPLQMGTQFLLAKEAKDFPRMIIKLEEKEWQDFFEKEARKLGKQVIV